MRADVPGATRVPWELGAMCLLLMMLPAATVIAGPLKGNGSPARLLAYAFFAMAALGVIAAHREASTRTFLPGLFVIGLYLILQLLVWAVGELHLDADVIETNKSRALLGLLAHTGVAFYAMTRVRTRSQLSTVLGCLAVGLTIACAAGLLQALAKIDLRTVLMPPGFVTNTRDDGSLQVFEAAERFGVDRLSGLSGHPIELAVLTAVTVPLTLHFARFARQRQTRFLAALATGIALLALPVGVSRSGVVALTVAMLIYIWTFRVRTLAVGLAAAVSLVLVQLAIAPTRLNALWQTIINSAEDESVLVRVDRVAKVSETFRENPWFGLGLGASPPSTYGFLDNEWLQAIVQGGLVGLASLVVFALGGIFGLAASLRGARDEAEPEERRRDRDRAYAMGAVFAGILASSFTFDLFGYQQATFTAFLVLGLMWSRWRIAYPVLGGTDQLRDKIIRT